MTPLELKALDYIRERVALGVPPTLDEISNHTGICSKSHAHRVVTSLELQGKLSRMPHRARGLTLGDQPDLTAAPTEQLKAELARRGVTLEALAAPTRMAFGRAVSCAADCCQVQVKRGHLFCRGHWFSLDQSLRDGILAAYGAKDVTRYQELVTRARDIIDCGTA